MGAEEDAQAAAQAAEEDTGEVQWQEQEEEQLEVGESIGGREQHWKDTRFGRQRLRPRTAGVGERAFCGGDKGS